MSKNVKQHKLLVGESGHLSDLAIGQSAKVMALHGDDKARRQRLLDMGITSGVIIKIKRIAPLGDPVGVFLRGYELLLRREDMANIDVEVVA